MPSQFLASYASVLQDVWGGTRPEWAVPAAEIQAAEQGLNTKLPTALSELYQLCGNFARLHKAIDRMREPVAREERTWRSGEPLERAGNRVVFYEDHECTGFFAFAADDPNRDDPRVFCAEEMDGDWREWGGSLTEFLLMQLHWQLGNGGAPFGGLAEIDEATVKLIRKQFPRALKLGGRLDHIEIFYRDGQSLVLFEDEEASEGYFMHCGMDSEAKFEALTEELQIQEWWDNWFPGDGTHDD